jgi:beta-RFAP synthase
MRSVPPAAVTVSTPSRLHFGLLRFAATEGPSYGGLGMMVAEPRCRMTLSRAESWQCRGAEDEGCQRVLEICERLVAQMRRAATTDALPAERFAARIELETAIPAHRGLGGGTQLALALAAGLRELAGFPPVDAAQIAQLAGRGRRSAVGTHGFLRGGLLWETGKLPGESLGRLAARVSVPENWRIVLAAPRNRTGLSGDSEAAAIASLPEVSRQATARLTALAENEILPAAEAADCRRFGDAVYEYNRLAGECYAPLQGGPYASREIADLVAAIRSYGVAGVGQSSWGPTVFAVVEEQRSADELVRCLASRPGLDVQVAVPDNRGAVVQVSLQSSAGGR